MNRWELTEKVKEKYKPIIKEFLDKIEGLTPEVIEGMERKSLMIVDGN